MDVLLDELIFEGDLVVAAIAGIAEVEVDLVDPVGDGNLHVPVVGVSISGVIPADAPEDVGILYLEPESFDAFEGRVAPGEDLVAAAGKIGPDIQRISSRVTEPDISFGVRDLRSAHVDPERSLQGHGVVEGRTGHRRAGLAPVGGDGLDAVVGDSAVGLVFEADGVARKLEDQLIVAVDVVACRRHAPRCSPGDLGHGGDVIFDHSRVDLDLGEAQVGSRYRDAYELPFGLHLVDGEVRAVDTGVVGKEELLPDQVPVRIENRHGEIGQSFGAAVEPVPQPDGADIVGVEQVDLPPGGRAVGVGGRSGIPHAIGIAVDGALRHSPPALGRLRREPSEGVVGAELLARNLALETPGTVPEVRAFAGVEVRVQRKDLKAVEDGVDVGRARCSSRRRQHPQGEGAIGHLDLEGVDAGHVLPREDTFPCGECEAVNVLLDDFIFERDRVVAPVSAGLAQVDVHLVDRVGNRQLHVPVLAIAADVPADAPEDGEILRGSAEAESLDAGGEGVGPVRDGLGAAEVVGANVERVGIDAFVTEPQVAV